jgi:hypothetical protein
MQRGDEYRAGSVIGMSEENLDLFGAEGPWEVLGDLKQAHLERDSLELPRMDCVIEQCAEHNQLAVDGSVAHACAASMKHVLVHD